MNDNGLRKGSHDKRLREVRADIKTEVTLELGPGFTPSTTIALLWQLGPSVGVMVPASVTYSGGDSRLRSATRKEVFPGWHVLHVARGDAAIALAEVEQLLVTARQTIGVSDDH